MSNDTFPAPAGGEQSTKRPRHKLVIAPTGYGGYALIDVSDEPLSGRGRWHGPVDSRDEAEQLAQGLSRDHSLPIDVEYVGRNANDVYDEVAGS